MLRRAKRKRRNIEKGQSPRVGLHVTNQICEACFEPQGRPLVFSANPRDHHETDRIAYEDLVPILGWLRCQGFLARSSVLLVWDPYYCNSAVINHLTTLGFPHAHNKNEDFYALVRDGLVPGHDVLVTNPPYIDDHIKRCVQYCATSRKHGVSCYHNLCTEMIGTRNCSIQEHSAPQNRLAWVLCPAPTHAHPGCHRMLQSKAVWRNVQ